MIKKIFLTCIFILYGIFSVYSLDAWIRINQLGYAPNGIKKAVLISESSIVFSEFGVYDALTNTEVETFSSFSKCGEYLSFSDVYVLDFTSFNKQGAYYLKVGNYYSPIIYIDKNIYSNAADFLLNYFRKQRSSQFRSVGYRIANAGVEIDGEEPKAIYVPLVEPISNKSSKSKKSTKNTSEVLEETAFFPLEEKILDVDGGWLNASATLKSGSINASSIYQLLFAYRMNPDIFGDEYNGAGAKLSNGIPDVLDEAKWGLDWLVKMNPAEGILYHQVGDDRPLNSNQPTETPVYRVVPNPQGLYEYKNKSTGAASVAGKYSAAFALGASVFEEYDKTYADTLRKKAFELYEYGKEYPGVSQSVPAKKPYYREEDNWADDLELAAMQLYRLSFNPKFLHEAAQFGRKEPVSPWVFADTCNYYQWYPFMNFGHYLLSNIENPNVKNEFLENIKATLTRANLKRKENPFQVSGPMVQGSNNYIVALANQCNLYRRYTNDSTFIELETVLIDWLFGCNPWGTSMVVGLPNPGVSPSNPCNELWLSKSERPDGGLVEGPVQRNTFEALVSNSNFEGDGIYSKFQSEQAVYLDNQTNFVSNATTLDGTASLLYLLSSKQHETASVLMDKNSYKKGTIIRTDASKKQINLVFVGHQFVDGKYTIQKILKKQKIQASFFFTGDFLRNRKNKKLIKKIHKDGHYIGPHSDKYLQYCSMENPDQLLVTKDQFKRDLKANFTALKKFDIEKDDAPFFIAPHFVMNDSISQWTKESGLKLLGCTPTVYVNADASVPEMREKYFSSLEIYNNIMTVEGSEGLNGQILVFNMGSDKHRTDKFYTRLDSLLKELKRKGYSFVDLYQSTMLLDKHVEVKQKKRNN